MSYIKKYGIAFPEHRISNKTLHPRLGGKGQHAICYTDEDIITLAYQAVSTLKIENEKIDAILFATTTPVFNNRYHASFVADLIGLNQGILAIDFGTSSRAGSDALVLADKLITSNCYKNILVIAAEVYYPEIGKETKTSFGHAAVAMIISSEKSAVELIKSKSFSSALAEEFSYKGETIQYDARFARTEGFKNNFALALKESNINTEKTNQIILHSPYAKIAFGQLTKAGFNIENQLLKDTITNVIGDTGVCHSLLLLINAIENKQKNIVLFDYLNGTNVLEFCNDTTTEFSSFKNNIGTQIENYQDYLQLRKQGKFTGKGYQAIEMFSSEMISVREKNTLLYLKGHECVNCGTVYYLNAARCNACHHTEFKQKQLNKTGIVYSITSEYYFPNSFPPTNMVIIDLDGGGRITVQQTNDMFITNETKINIGDKVELVYRKMMENDKKPNYFWKCKKQ